MVSKYLTNILELKIKKMKESFETDLSVFPEKGFQIDAKSMAPRQPIKERVQSINLKTQLNDFLSASNSIFSVKYSQQIELEYFSSDLECILKFVRLCKKLLFTLSQCFNTIDGTTLKYLVFLI